MQWVVGALGGLSILFAGGAWWFIRGPADPAPREGKVLAGGVLVVWTPAYQVSFFGIESFHPFDIGKVKSVGPYLVDEGLLSRSDFAVPEAVSDEALSRVHSREYLASLHRTPTLGEALEVTVPDIFPASIVEARVLQPFRKAVGGTLLAARGAITHGVGINLGGGFHHARPAHGHGFCIYNDVAYAIAVLRQEGFNGKILIVDTDAHQGDGNHVFFMHDPTVTTYSIHGKQLFPHPKVPGTRDTELDAGVGDTYYLERLRTDLDAMLNEAPALVIHVAGSDVLGDDPLGDMALTPDGLVARDRLVFEAARAKGAAFLHTLSGGYGPSSAMAQARSVAGILREAQTSGR